MTTTLAKKKRNAIADFFASHPSNALPTLLWFCVLPTLKQRIAFFIRFYYYFFGLIKKAISCFPTLERQNHSQAMLHNEATL